MPGTPRSHRTLCTGRHRAASHAQCCQGVCGQVPAGAPAGRNRLGACCGDIAAPRRVTLAPWQQWRCCLYPFELATRGAGEQNLKQSLRHNHAFAVIPSTTMPRGQT
jgi:hypothetical protein